VKALRFAKTGDLAHLALAECPAPLPGAGEVLVRVKAAGLNRSDVSNVMGGHPYTTLPRTPGRDFAGVVESGPAAFVGKAVWGTGKELGFTSDGSHAEYLVLPAEGVALKPERLSFAEAASCGVPYITAWHALAGVERGTKVLVIGAAGAVGVAATHLARLRGAAVAGAVRRSEQAALLEKSGFRPVLLAEGEPIDGNFDLIFDTTGQWLSASIGALARFGRVAVIVAPGDGRQSVPVRELYRRAASIVGVNSLLYSCLDCARLLSDLRPHFETGELPPPYSLEPRALVEGVEAYVALRCGHKGKLVLVP
jgi:NADPH:quinone reductase